MTKLKIAIVEDKPQLRESLQRNLLHSGEVELAFAANNGDDFLQKMKALPTNAHPAAVLMDIEMPVMDGIETVQRASAIYPALRFIMLTVFDDEERIFTAIRSGAHGYLLKDEPTVSILAAVRQVLDGLGAPMSPAIARRVFDLLNRLPFGANPQVNASEPALLSDRETDILRCMAEGLEYREIGEKLFISPHTVRKHIANIYEKLHVGSKLEAVQLGKVKKWI
jgi:DNA-binding NarL/FixJ family response regulator